MGTKPASGRYLGEEGVQTFSTIRSAGTGRLEMAPRLSETRGLGQHCEMLAMVGAGADSCCSQSWQSTGGIGLMRCARPPRLDHAVVEAVIAARVFLLRANNSSKRLAGKS